MLFWNFEQQMLFHSPIVISTAFLNVYILLVFDFSPLFTPPPQVTAFHSSKWHIKNFLRSKQEVDFAQKAASPKVLTQRALKSYIHLPDWLKSNCCQENASESTNLRAIKSRWLKCNLRRIWFRIIILLASGIHLNRKQKQIELDEAVRVSGGKYWRINSEFNRKTSVK